jgi:hypothetical protein
MCIIPSIAIGSNFQAIQNNNFMKLEQHRSCPRQLFFHSACCTHQSAELSLELWNFLSFEHNTLCVCVCVKQAVSVFVLSLYTRHKQAHDANQQKPAAQASVTIYICFGQWDELT